MGTQRDLRSLADEDLMALVQRGEPDAFEVLYDRHADASFSLAYRMVGTRPAAEDVVQEAFLAIWRSRVRYRSDRGSVRTWVLGIVHHRAVDGLRRHLVHDRRRGGDSETAELREAPERTDLEVVRRDEADRVRTALGSLPEDQSRVIELAYFGGFTHAEISGMLEMPLGTVKGRMRLGLDKMRRELQEAV
jgi:RNA polymerase sigma-70 factor, ECF subfamily